MKFTQYIEEASKYQLKLYGVIQALFKNSMPFIKELRKSGNELIWRGSNKSRTKSIIQVTPRQDRSPKDMPGFLHDSLNDEFGRKFGWRPRSEGVFTVARKMDAQSYGDPYIFFPVGKYRYLYNPMIQDLFSEVEDSDTAGFDDADDYISSKASDWEDEWEYEYGEGQRGEWAYLGETLGTDSKTEAFELAAEFEGWEPDEIPETDLTWEPDVDWLDFYNEKKQEAEDTFENFIENSVRGYKDKNLSLAIKKYVEIMFDCKSYYLVNQHFANDVEKYVLKGEKYHFDPKQKQLGFERSSKTRGQKQLKHPEWEGAAWELSDPKSSKYGLMSGHKKYMSVLKKSHKGQQQKFK